MLRTKNIFRQPTSRMSSRYKGAGLTQKESVQRRKLATLIRQHLEALQVFDEMDPFNPARNLVEENMFRSFVMFFELSVATVPRPVINRNPIARTIDSFSDYGDDSCWNLFKLRKDDLRDLYQRLRFPFRVRVGVDDQKDPIMFGEEIFLAGLCRLCSTETDVKLYPSRFGRDESAFNKAFHYFISHMLENWGYLLRDMLPFWIQHAQLLSRLMATKLVEKVPDLEIDINLFRVFALIDCTVIASCRPGGGPVHHNPDSPR